MLQPEISYEKEVRKMSERKQISLNDTTMEKIDALVAEKIGENTPGCTAAVLHYG